MEGAADMTQSRRILAPLYWVVTLALLAAGTVMAMAYPPTEATMGEVQRIFYMHMPIAVTMFLACFVVFIASAGYLLQRRMMWDDLAQAGAEVAVLFASVVLITGMIWGRSAWGYWWTWSPRLTFSLMLWLLYLVYLMVRPSIESPQRRALVASVYGVVAFLDVPLVYASAKLLPDIHPESISLAPEMQQTVLFWFLPVLLLCGGLITARWRTLRQMREAHEEIADDDAFPENAIPAAGETP
jgi:heme exporter protein C